MRHYFLYVMCYINKTYWIEHVWGTCIIGSKITPTTGFDSRSDLSSQELSLPLAVSERLVNSCERSDLSDRGYRSLNSSERERINHQQPANANKHNNQEVS